MKTRAEEESERLQRTLRERDETCGPYCASSTLQTQWQKIQRQDRLLEMARAALLSLRTAHDGGAEYERAGAIAKEIDEERGTA